MTSASEALERLREGNEHFVAGSLTGTSRSTADRRREVAGGQAPFAAILSCSDSRVPPEIVFHQGLGDLFVIRVAGNVAGPTQIGSIEFASRVLGVRLVVVMGHSSCGAVTAAMRELERPSEDPSPNLASILDLVGPSVVASLEAGSERTRDQLIRDAVRANVRNTVGRLRTGSSKILEELVETEGLQIIGAEYSIETGAVEFMMDGSDVG